MVVKLLDTSKLVELSSKDEPQEKPEEDEPEEDPVEDLEKEEPDVEQDIKDAESTVSGDGTGNSFDSGEEPEDNFNSHCNPSRDYQDDSTSIFLVGHFLEPHVFSTVGFDTVMAFIQYLDNSFELC